MPYCVICGEKLDADPVEVEWIGWNGPKLAHRHCHERNVCRQCKRLVGEENLSLGGYCRECNAEGLNVILDTGGHMRPVGLESPRNAALGAESPGAERGCARSEATPAFSSSGGAGAGPG